MLMTKWPSTSAQRYPSSSTHSQIPPSTSTLRASLPHCLLPHRDTTRAYPQKIVCRFRSNATALVLPIHTHLRCTPLHHLRVTSVLMTCHRAPLHASSGPPVEHPVAFLSMIERRRASLQQAAVQCPPNFACPTRRFAVLIEPHISENKATIPREAKLGKICSLSPPCPKLATMLCSVVPNPHGAKALMRFKRKAPRESPLARAHHRIVVADTLRMLPLMKQRRS